MRRSIPALATAAVLLAGALAGGCSSEPSGAGADRATATTNAVTTPDPAAPLAAGPAALGDETVVGSPYYPDAASLPSPGRVERSPDELVHEAQALVGARDPGLAVIAGELFADTEVAARVPAPELRAALVALLGTKHGRPVARVVPVEEDVGRRPTDGSVRLVADEDETYYSTCERWGAEA